MHLPCARSHANASKLAAVLVDRFFPQCLVARREERRGRGREDRREKREEGKKREERERRKEREQERERRGIERKKAKQHKNTHHPHNTQHHHDQTSTPTPTQHTTHQTTDRDLESVFVKRKVNAWTRAHQSTDRDLEGVST